MIDTRVSDVEIDVSRYSCCWNENDRGWWMHDETILRCLTSTEVFQAISKAKRFLSTRQLYPFWSTWLAPRHSSRQSSTFFKDNTWISTLWSQPAGVFNYSHAQPPVFPSSSYRRLPEKFSFLVGTSVLERVNVFEKRCISKNTRPTPLKLLFFSVSVLSISCFAEIEAV